MRMWWYEFTGQTEEWYKVHGTGNGTGGCRFSASSGTDDTRGHMTGWRYCTLSSSIPFSSSPPWAFTEMEHGPSSSGFYQEGTVARETHYDNKTG